jgi:hypothetical protein
MGIRVVTTGLSEDGKAVFTSDSIEEPLRPPIIPGNEINLLWGADEIPHTPNDGAAPGYHGFYPPAGGYRFMVNHVPPATFVAEHPVADPAAAAEESERMLPGIISEIDDAAGMHRTSTVDLEMVLAGSVWLTLDSGESKEIRAGECIIQNGVNHRWENRSATEQATLLIVFIGAHADR